MRSVTAGDLVQVIERSLFTLDGWYSHPRPRQLDNGKWTSKLGKAEDVEHDGLMLSILSYGQPVLFLLA